MANPIFCGQDLPTSQLSTSWPDPGTLSADVPRIYLPFACRMSQYEQPQRASKMLKFSRKVCQYVEPFRHLTHACLAPSFGGGGASLDSNNIYRANSVIQGSHHGRVTPATEHKNAATSLGKLLTCPRTSQRLVQPGVSISV